MISQLVAVVLFFLYIAYFVGWVRKHMIYELYKLNNLIRALLMGIMCINTYAGLIPLIVVEVILIIVDIKMYSEIKLSKKLYGLDRIAMAIAIICGCLIDLVAGIYIVLGVSVGILALIKGYYIVIRIVDWIDDRKKRQLSDISVSDIVHQSVKD